MRTWYTADEIQIAVALDSWKPTRGTRLTGQRNTGRHLVFSKQQTIGAGHDGGQTGRSPRPEKFLR
jgi:hypothetical protein